MHLAEMDLAAVVQKLRILDMVSQPRTVNVTEWPGKNMQVECIGLGVVGVAAIGGRGELCRGWPTAIDGAAVEPIPSRRSMARWSKPTCCWSHVEQQVTTFADAIHEHTDE
jgi:hypothetical protein